MSLILVEIISKQVKVVWNIKETQWITMVFCILMNLHSFSTKTDCTNEYSIQKLSRNSLFCDSNAIQLGRNNYQVSFSCMENQEMSMKNTVLMHLDELTFIFT